MKRRDLRLVPFRKYNRSKLLQYVLALAHNTCLALLLLVLGVIRAVSENS